MVKEELARFKELQRTAREEARTRLEESKTERERYKAEKESTRLKGRLRGTEATRIKKKERAVRGLVTAAGTIQGKQTYSGRGRPRGTYKFGMPIHVYKQKLKEQKSTYQKYLEEKQGRLAAQGFTPEQVQQLQQQQTIEEMQPQQQMQMQPSRVQVIRQLQADMQPEARLEQARQIQIVPQRNFNVPTKKYAQDMPFRNPSDDDLEFTRWRAEQTIHPNTQRLLTEVRRVQLLGQKSNIEQARRHRERLMLAKQMNLMKAHENMTNVNMNFVGVPEDNILFAPSVFRENPDNHILKPRGMSLLNTREGGNDLNFWS